ncbi:MAG TPA: universal stress protein [Candidatus Angelobacter sp.]|nr:universal stress protein [Candidatus Angelobacter sp.]
MAGTGRRHPVFQRILVGYDGSQQAERAANLAFSMAKVVDCKVLLFAVTRPPEPATSGTGSRIG